MCLRPVLVELDLALQLQHLQLKGDDAVHHLVLVVLAQSAPLVGVGRVMVGNQVFEQVVLVIKMLNQPRLDGAMNGDVIPCRHAHQIRVDARRHVGVRTHESHDRFRSGLKITPVRIGLGTMAQQDEWCFLAGSGGLLQVQWQMGYIGKTGIVGADQAGKGVGLHQHGRLPGVALELRRKVHALKYGRRRS